MASTIESDLSGLKILCDCANGASSATAPALFARFKAKTDFIHTEPDGVNINSGCGSTHLEKLAAAVVAGGYDIGVAFDGDADRCLLVDENGQTIDGDKVMAVCATDMKRRGVLNGDTIVATVMSNLGLHEFCRNHGLNLVCTAVGDRNVLEEMLRHDYRIGGEQSGHIIFGKYANTGDGLLTAIKLMQVMLDRKKKLSELAAPVREYPQQLTNVEVDDKDATLSAPAVVAAEQTVTERLGDEGRILVRKSGTEPVLRVMVEAGTHELCEENVAYVIDVMRKSGHLIRVR